MSIISEEEEDDDRPVASSVVTVDEMLSEGIRLAKLDEMKSKRSVQERDFIDRYGSTPTVLAYLWEDLQTTTIAEARVSEKDADLRFFLIAMHFLKQYPTESERKAANQQRVHTQRDWVWFFVNKIAALRAQKIVWPESHSIGDDIWVATVDGTMSASNERSHPTLAKDPEQFSFKHKSAGFNVEIAVSIKESRCIWINGPYKAGKYADRVIFKAPGGLRDKLVSVGKKAIADGGYTGYPAQLSTPNIHDAKEVRTFKSRALKRHEKFNGMLKCFKCLSVKFRHKEKFIETFQAVTVICQYQLEHGQPLWAIYV